MSQWDDGIRWYTRRTVDPVDPPVQLDYVKKLVLRIENDAVEDEHIRALIDAATEAAEDATQRALMPQTWEQVLSGFPCREIVVQRPPLVAVTSIQYYDANNDLQTWGSSPLVEYLVIPSGAASKASIVRGEDQEWPETFCRPDAVTVTFTAGVFPVAPRIVQGICLHVAEQYKQRSLGVINVHHAPATLQLAHFWKRVP